MPKESLKHKRDRAKTIFSTLNKAHPGVTTFLTHKNHYELLIAVILSAQCTDERVNKTTPQLFQHYPSPEALATATLEDVKHDIKSINFFNNKAQNIIKTAQHLVTTHNGSVPDTLEALIQCPGVGRKTANVVLGQAFGKPGITVDTHVNRVTRRLGFTTETTPEKVETDCQKCWSTDIWSHFSTLLIIHGRQVCKARKPQCDICQLSTHCPKKI